jgi:hypothetical protein
MNSSRLSSILEQILTVMAAIFFLMGAGGLIIVITASPIFNERMLDFAYTFIYAYMMVLGILLYTYRNKIIIKK